MPLSEFQDLHWRQSKDHPQYHNSILMPVAPEWTVGEVLLSAAYRKLLLGHSEGDVDRTEIETHLLEQLKPNEMWHDLLTRPGGLASPRPARERLGLRQLTPLVPELALYSGVLGRKRKGRWDPGRLLVSVIQSGAGIQSWEDNVRSLSDALRVGPNDDLFAQFVEMELRKIRGKKLPPEPDRLPLYSPAWRASKIGQKTPAERFVHDLGFLLSLKSRLTRRQWTVLLEAQFRLALGMHMLWICRLNEQVWALTQDALEFGKCLTPEEVEKRCWTGHGLVDPLLELGGDAGRLIRRRISAYAQARIGINIVLHSLDGDERLRWTSPLGVSDDLDSPPSHRIAEFLRHVVQHAREVGQQVQELTGLPSVGQLAGRVADANPRFLRADQGSTKNLMEFLVHTLVEMNVSKEDVEMSSYDQAYVAARQRGKAENALKFVRPGPATLIFLVHACCSAQGDIPASLDDFREFIAGYGISAPAGELQHGPTGRHLESLGLVVDSPDAGGGRILVDPF